MRSIYLVLFPVFFFFPASVIAQTLQTKSINELAIYPSYLFSAEVQAQSATTISAQINAQLLEFSVKNGEEIPAGKRLARFDCADLQDQLALNRANQQELQANLRLAQLQFKRLNELQGRQLAADSSVDESLARKQALEAQFMALKTQAKLAERAISRCEIRAPFRGVVSEKYVGQGQWLTVGAPLLKLTQLDAAELAVQVPLSLFQQDDFTALMNSAVLQNAQQNIALQSWRVSKQTTAQSKMVTVWFAAPKGLLIGQQLQVVFTRAQAFLPAGILVKRAGKVGVFVVENQQAKFVALENAQMGRPAPVPQTLLNHPETKVVVDGQLSLQNGDSAQESP